MSRASPAKPRRLRVRVADEGDRLRLSYAARQLVLVEDQNAEVCTIGGLTEGEARWVGQVLLAERAAWR